MTVQLYLKNTAQILLTAFTITPIHLIFCLIEKKAEGKFVLKPIKPSNSGKG